MAGDAILGFLSGMMKKKEEKFKEELRRKADLNALFEEIKSRQGLEPKKSEYWINKTTQDVVEVPANASPEQKDKLKSQNYVPKDVYYQVTTADKKTTKVIFSELPEEFRLTVPYFQHLDKDLQNILLESYTEAKQPKNTGLLTAIKKAQDKNKPPKQTSPLPSLKDILIPKSVKDKINATTMIKKPVSKTEVKVSRPLRDTGLIKKKDNYWTPRYVDTTR